MTAASTIKCVVVGDEDVGKTCLLLVYGTDQFPDKFVPSVLDSFTVTSMIGDESLTPSLHDTPTEGHYDRLRPLSYDKTDVFLICFSIVSPTSFENCREKWFPEVHYHVPRPGGGVPCLLVGLKADLRYDPTTIANLEKKKETPVPKDAGEALAREMGARGYFEVSALTRCGVRDLFDEAIVAALQPPSLGRKKKRKCVIV